VALKALGQYVSPKKEQRYCADRSRRNTNDEIRNLQIIIVVGLKRSAPFVSCRSRVLRIESICPCRCGPEQEKVQDNEGKHGRQQGPQHVGSLSWPFHSRHSPRQFSSPFNHIPLSPAPTPTTLDEFISNKVPRSSNGGRGWPVGRILDPPPRASVRWVPSGA
jgi:hypothetical protein